MGIRQKVVQRIRRRLMLPGENWAEKKHGECANFDNGTCLVIPRLFKGVVLNPKAPACVHFKSKKIIKTRHGK